jgi:hypothetical protein
MYFGSYQGTRQRNGMAGGYLSTVSLPPLTNDRSPAALGAIFAGKVGYFNYLLGVTTGVPNVAADGSNINSVALNILQKKLPNGELLIPTPQTVRPRAANEDPNNPAVIDGLGTSSYSVPCPYTEDQHMINVGYLQSDNSKWMGRFFAANSDSVQSLASGIPGFGKTREGKRGAGLIFFNDKGDECGGMTWSGKGEGDKASANGGIMFDQYNSDQIVGIRYGQHGQQNSSGMQVWERPMTSMRSKT